MSELLQNPLLNYSALPNFSQVKVEHIIPAVEKTIADCKQVIISTVEKAQDNPTWDNLMSPIEEAEDKFSKIWSVISHLNSVMNNKEFREEHDKCLPIITEFSAFAGQYKPLYDALVKMSKSYEFNLLTKAQRKAIENSLRDFKLTGVHLAQQEKEKFLEISTKLSELSSKFSNNVLDATDKYLLNVTDVQRLKGLPESALSNAQELAKNKGQQGYSFSLHMPSYIPLMTYCEDRQLRQEAYIAYVTRASDKGPFANEFDNAAIINEILDLRYQLAKLLGFSSYAELSLQSKMAENPQEVIDFLTSLAQKSHAQGLREIEELSAFAQEDGIDKLEAWDLAFYSEKLKQKLFSFSEEELRAYFPADKVIAGLFECAKRIYSISFRPRLGVDVWHKDVKCYDIYDDFGSHIGTFYIDLYAREGKRGGAWMDECMSRRYRRDGALQLPVAYVVCNFTAPLKDKPSLLTHDEVTTLFHEFGHAFNQLLTRIDISAVSGINGVPWDAVELPSQFNENFCWQEEVLDFLSCHVESQQPLPKDKLKSLLKAKNYHSAMAMLRQLEFALFDMRIHLEYSSDGAASFVDDTLNKVKELCAVTPQYADNRFKDSFSHIFAGGYAAGYYSYKWAEVLAADAFGRFEEEGIFNKEVGRDFRDYIMASGGADDVMQNFISFRGRKPSVDALLKQSGIAA